MRGYLQRIAASVVRPQPAVHPFVESAFSASRREEPAEPLLREERFSAAVPVERAAAHGLRDESRIEAPQPVQASASPSGEPVEHETLVAAPVERVAPRIFSPEPSARTPQPRTSPMGPLQEIVQRLTAATPTIEPEAFQPLLPRSEIDPKQSADPPRAGASRQDRPESGSPEATREVPRFEPIIPKDLSPVRAAAGLVRRPRVELPPGPRSPQPPADEIQIHIGRIEVVAVQPAAPRPATPPARKALSLDEYLSRRNGRAG
jgi:hypothetical protein